MWKNWSKNTLFELWTALFEMLLYASPNFYFMGWCMWKKAKLKYYSTFLQNSNWRVDVCARNFKYYFTLLQYIYWWVAVCGRKLSVTFSVHFRILLMLKVMAWLTWYFAAFRRWILTTGWWYFNFEISSVFFAIVLSFAIHHMFKFSLAALPAYCFEWWKYHVSWLT